MRTRSLAFGLGIVVLTLAACGNSGSAVAPATAGSLAGQPAQSRSAAQSVAIDPATGPHAIAYCGSSGGVYEVRRAEYGTNNPNPLPLAKYAGFCKYTAKDGSRIYIFADTLYTTKPTLAVLAYRAKVPTGTCQGNPASCYCTLLGGSDQFGGTTGAGGGWVLKGSIDESLEACIFPDLSSIDSWGLAYHANNIIRGINLASVVRYKP